MDHKRDIWKRRKELRAANNNDNPASSWKKIAYLEEKLDAALDKEERYWRQRAKVEWLNKGDKNSRFFYMKASVRKARNKIRGLKDEAGNWKETDVDMEGIISNYFQKLFTSTILMRKIPSWSWTMWKILSPRIWFPS
ncbi:hypothetical protein Dsin_021882 [Dipteronia sinensis]|uniref:Uncharacterized protein n=1 Tax=Dipteronia sinensis TaxID=43782 RepID=A0AAE0A1D5_9ROSI|nr:hypothetical protein Dsin_021882 [Dipteronia sinensis]